MPVGGVADSVHPVGSGVVQTSTTVISFWVSVPVLSVQMTVVLPSVSTAGSRRTTARRRAMRPTPIAKVMVTAAGRPSGIAPTARATAAVNMSDPGSPRAIPTMKVTTARPRMITVRIRLNSARRRVRGVASGSTAPDQPVDLAQLGGGAGRHHDAGAADPRVTRVPE